MATVKRFITIGSLALLSFFAVFAVTTPLLREPPIPVVNVTIVPPAPVQPPEVVGEPAADSSRAHEVGMETGERLKEMWRTTKEFSGGLWATLTKEDY